MVKTNDKQRSDLSRNHAPVNTVNMIIILDLF